MGLQKNLCAALAKTGRRGKRHCAPQNPGNDRKNRREGADYRNGPPAVNWPPGFIVAAPQIAEKAQFQALAETASRAAFTARVTSAMAAMPLTVLSLPWAP